MPTKLEAMAKRLSNRRDEAAPSIDVFALDAFCCNFMISPSQLASVAGSDLNSVGHVFGHLPHPCVCGKPIPFSRVRNAPELLDSTALNIK